MGAKESTLTKCRKNTTVSEIEKKAWWKKGRIRKTKIKSTELKNGVLQKCEETTKKFRDKDNNRYISEVIIHTSIVGKNAIQEKGTDQSGTSRMSGNKKNNTNNPSESEIKQPEQESGQDLVVSLLPNSSTDIESTFCLGVMSVKSDEGKSYIKTNKFAGNNDYSSIKPSLLYSIETDIIKQQPSLLNSRLDANFKESSYDTELKAFNDSLCSQNHEMQFMKILSFDDKEVDGDSYSNNMQTQMYLKTVDSDDDEEAEPFMTSVKDVFSSYPDSDLHSDECSHRITQTSDEHVSVSACGSYKCGPDSSILFKQTDECNDILYRHCQALSYRSGCLVQRNFDQIIDTENVVRMSALQNQDNIVENQTVHIQGNEKCENSASCKTKALNSIKAADRAMNVSVEMVGINGNKSGEEIDSCQGDSNTIAEELSTGLGASKLASDLICIAMNAVTEVSKQLMNVFQFQLVGVKVVALILVSYLNKQMNTMIYRKGQVLSHHSGCLVQSNLDQIIDTENVVRIEKRCETARPVIKCQSICGVTSDAQISVAKFVWEEMQKLICMLYFLENIKIITLKLDNRTENTMKGRKQPADKEAGLMYAGTIDSTENETIKKDNLVQNTSLKNEYRCSTVSYRNCSEKNIEENYDRFEIHSEISALQNQDNQNVHKQGNEKCENSTSCKTKALNSIKAADRAMNVSVQMVGINSNKSGEEIDSCQGDSNTIAEELSTGLSVSKLASVWFYPKLKGHRNISDDPKLVDIKHDIKLSESDVEDSQKEIDEKSTYKEGSDSQSVKYLKSSEAKSEYSFFNSCIEPIALNGVGFKSIDEIAVRSTRRIDRIRRNKIKLYEEKRNDKMITELTNQQQLSLTVKHVKLSDKASRDGKRSLRKKYRFKEKGKNPRTTEDIDASKPSLKIKEKHSKTIQPNQKDLLSKFCKTCHQQIHKHNANCRNWQSVRAETDTDMFHNHVSKLDSGIASMLSSARSLILSQMESLQSLASVGKKVSRKQVLNELFNLGLLNQRLKRITKDFNFDALSNADHSIIAFPGLQSYFDSLRDGVTPSLQERMTYEWLRLVSFSLYNGGGSPVHLARGGFFHHQGNETRCFCCNVSYSNWTFTDDVQTVHRRISPDCPFVVQGVESNRNTPIENSGIGNLSQPPSTQQSVITPSISSTERPGSHSSVTHSGFLFGSAPGTTRMNQTGTPETAGGVPRFSFYPDPSAARNADQAAEEADISSQVTSQLCALPIQQVAAAQQPTEEPVSLNPVIDLTAIQRHGSSFSRPPHSGTEIADTLLIGTLKYPRYESLNVRMSSFASWPSYLNQTPRQMAYAGFFHPGVADFARCFCCGGGLRNWEADDDPMVEHARWYPRCEYIKKLKGTHFVQAVLRRHREHMAERQREQERSADNSFTSPDPMTTEVAASLLEMGFTQERAREAILTVRRLRGRSEVTAEEVTAWMLDDDNAQQSEPHRAGTIDTAGTRDTVRSEERSEQRNALPSSNRSGSLEPSVTTQGATSGSTGSSVEAQGAAGGGGDKQVETKTASNDKTEVDSSADEMAGSGKAESSTSEKAKSKKGKKSKSRKGHSPSGEGATSSHGDIDTKSLKEENKLLNRMQVCKICMDKYVSVTFLPCGHLVCCEECARSMRKCPICRKRIKGQVKTFMS